MQIVPFDRLTPKQHGKAARILVDAFVHAPSAWNTLVEAEDEVAEFLEEEEYSAWAGVEDDVLVGWIGAIQHHDAAWELHPLCIDPALQGKGCGSALVAALEAAARDAGVVTIWLGTDDDFGGTSIFGQDLYPDPLLAMKDLAPVSNHPYRFYEKLGYVVTGVLPDVNGPGKHDIMMAKQIRP